MGRPSWPSVAGASMSAPASAPMAPHCAPFAAHSVRRRERSAVGTDAVSAAIEKRCITPAGPRWVSDAANSSTVQYVRVQLGGSLRNVVPHASLAA